MGAEDVGRVALMSIHPEYAFRIIAGEKKVEFRKMPISVDVTHVIIYATAPVSAVIGAFSVSGQVTAHPSLLWRHFQQVAGIDRNSLMEYYKQHEKGTGIAVGDIYVPKVPLKLGLDISVSRPPQSFQYLPADVADRTLSAMGAVSS